MAIGDFHSSAQAFEELARGAVARNGPRAPLLLLQAGRLEILAGQVSNGMPYPAWAEPFCGAQQVRAIPQLRSAGRGGPFPARTERAGQNNRGNPENQPAGRFRSLTWSRKKYTIRSLPTNGPGFGSPLHAN